MTHYINPKLSDRQKSIIKGTVLGGSSLVKPKGGKNAYLSMRSKDGKWLDFKALELKEVSSQEPITIEKTNRWHSLCYPVFSDYRKLFYENNERSLTIDTLDKLTLTDIAFMVWFVDAGSHDKNGAIFNTNIWGEKGSEAVVKYFSFLDWKAEIFTERKGFRVRLDAVSSDKLMKMISPIFPHFYAVNFNH